MTERSRLRSLTSNRRPSKIALSKMSSLHRSSRRRDRKRLKSKKRGRKKRPKFVKRESKLRSRQESKR